MTPWRHSGVFIVNCEHISHLVLVLYVNFEQANVDWVMLKKLKNAKVPWKNFHFLRDILGILDSFRYSNSSEPVNYLFFAAFEVVIQIYNLFSMQEFYNQKGNKHLYVRWSYAFFGLF